MTKQINVLLMLFILGLGGCSANLQNNAGNAPNVVEESTVLMENDEKEMEELEQSEELEEKEDDAQEKNEKKYDIRDGFAFIQDKKIRFERRSIPEGRCSMIIPESFHPMSNSLAKIKYPLANRPKFILTNESSSVNITFSHMEDKMKEEEIEKTWALTRTGMRMMFDQSAEFIDRDTIVVNGKKIASFVMISRAIDTDIYNLMFCFSLDDRKVMGTFNCMLEEREDWENLFDQMLESIEFE